MAKKAENGKITKIEKPYGGSTVKERKAAMSRGLTEEELKARNTIPETNPAGEPHRIIAEELYSENDTFVPYKPDAPNDPGPAAHEPLKEGVLREGQKITDRIGVKVAPTDPDYWGTCERDDRRRGSAHCTHEGAQAAHVRAAQKRE